MLSIYNPLHTLTRILASAYVPVIQPFTMSDDFDEMEEAWNLSWDGCLDEPDDLSRLEMCDPSREQEVDHPSADLSCSIESGFADITSTGLVCLQVDGKNRQKHSSMTYRSAKLEGMTAVYSLNSQPLPVARFRRRMTPQEKIAYRERRFYRACDKCKGRKKKVLSSASQLAVHSR